MSDLSAGREYDFYGGELYGKILDNAANARRQGNGITPLIYINFPERNIFRDDAVGLNFGLPPQGRPRPGNTEEHRATNHPGDNTQKPTNKGVIHISLGRRPGPPAENHQAKLIHADRQIPGQPRPGQHHSPAPRCYLPP